MKRFASIVVNFCLVFVLVSVCGIQARAVSYAYSPQKALDYAEAHWDDGVGVCDQFVKACLDAGGVEVRAGGVQPVMEALLDAGYGTGIQKLTTYKDIYVREEDNQGLIKAGDPIFFKCVDCDFYTHTVISSGYNQDGYLMTYGHNPACKDYLYHGTIHHTLEDGTLHENFEIYTVNMSAADPGHKHAFNKDLYETAHPHRMYDACKVSGCGAKYYLGWTATVRGCHICNPSPNGKPVVTLDLNPSGSVEVSWTALADVKEYQVWRGKSLNGTYFKIATTNGAYITNSSVTEGVTYYYKIVAVLNNGKQVTGDVVSITVGGELEKPVVTVTFDKNEKPVISWAAVNGANGYEVFRAEGTSGSFISMMVVGTDTFSYTNTGAEADKTYRYKVCALFGDVNSESEIVTVTCPTQSGEGETPEPEEPEKPVLTAPVYTVDNNADGKPTLKWSAVDGAKSYQVYRATTKTGAYSKVFTTAGTSYTHTSATVGKTYYYKVKAVYENGEELFGAVVSGVCRQPQTEEIEIVITTGNNAEGKPTMKWNKVTGAKSYEVYRATSKTGTYSKVFTTGGTSYTHSSATAGKTYYYKLKVVLSSGGEEYSEIVSNQFRAPAAEEEEIEIVITTGNNTEGKPTMKWNKVTGAKSYEVYRATSKTGAYSKVFTTGGTSYTHSSATAGKIYYYKLKVVLSSGGEEYSEIVSNQFRAPAAEEEEIEIVITTGNNAEGKPTMKWNKVTGAKSYEVYRATSKTGTYSKVFTTGGTSYTHSSATAGKTYYYKLKVVLSSGGEEYSEIVSNQFRAPAAEEEEIEIVITTGNNAEGKPTMKWNKVTGAETYQVYRATSKTGTYSKVFTTTGTSYTHASATAGKTYYYKLEVILANGDKEISNVVSNACAK